ncbi:MAG: ParA family protein [Gemmatimonadaceae bacterium]|nr:ParA family protein [Gemmatimonadaceae bacterium]NUQ94311.1 ParA family protein [Gemmatimonadaceae bacterium]NUR20926.1 ParA family protein [Gemmatimonadaceae bacterium]
MSAGKVLAIVSQKGGVGKTTTAVNLAAAFARRGVRTILVDVDPQGSVRYGIGLRPGQPTPGITEYLSGDRALQEVLLPTPLASLRVLLAGAIADRGDHADFQRQITTPGVLDELFDELAGRADLVIVDTPPGLGAIVRRVLEASAHAIVPLQCEPLALQTTPQILRGLQDIVAVNEELALEGMLLTMHEPENPMSERVAEYVRASLPEDLVFEREVPRTAAVVEASAAGQPVVLRDPNDPASAAYLDLADVLRERMG